MTRADLRASGASNRMVQGMVGRGVLVGLGRGVYRWQGSPPTWRQQALAAVRAAGPGAVLSHHSAAALHELAGCRPGILHVAVPLSCRRRSDRATLHRTVVDDGERTVVDHIPVATVPLVLVQLAATVSGTRLEDAVDDALCRRLATVEQLTSSCRHGRDGSAALRAVAALWRPGDRPGSLAEARLVRVLAARGLPPPALQHPVTEGSGRLVARLDLAWPEQRVAVELDSFRWHGARRSHGATARRRNRLEALGWRVLVATTADAGGVDDLVDVITTLLSRADRRSSVVHRSPAVEAERGCA